MTPSAADSVTTATTVDFVHRGLDDRVDRGGLDRHHVGPTGVTGVTGVATIAIVEVGGLEHHDRGELVVGPSAPRAVVVPLVAFVVLLSS